MVQSPESNIAVDESPNAVENSGGGFPLWGWVISLGAVALIGIGGYNYYRINERTKPRKCPSCDDYMEMLDEEEDDLYLNTGQRAEEYLSSVDYDVWVCPTDGATSVYPHEAMWSKYSKCPTCSYRTVDKYDEVLEAPTVISAGRKRIVADCHHCSYNRSEVVVLPRIQQAPAMPRGRSQGGWSTPSAPRPVSAPRRSSPFGGGRGGGGGATGSW